MKPIIIILTILFSINIYGGKHHLSIKGGGAYSGTETVVYVNNVDFDFLDYKFIESFSLTWGIDIDSFRLNIGIDWRDKGFLRNYDNPIRHEEITIKSIELPIYLDYKVIKNTKVFLGGFLAIPTNIWYIVRGVNPINSGFILGLEYNINSFLFDFRIEQGVGKFYSFSNVPGGGTTDTYLNNTQIIFMVGYQFF